MRDNGVEVTLKAATGETSTDRAKFTLETGSHGGHIYRSDSGFWVEIIGGLDSTHRVVDFGWHDGRRGYDLINIWPIVIG